MGEDLDSLSLKDLQSLEHQLHAAIKSIRSRKVILERTFIWIGVEICDGLFNKFVIFAEPSYVRIHIGAPKEGIVSQPSRPSF